MDIRELEPGHAVSPQIEPSDLARVAEAGFVTVICNRPDAENPPERQSDAMRAAAEAAGLRSMREDGERLVAQGITSPEEVLRVTRD